MLPKRFKGVLQYAFEQKQCESVVVIIEPDHIASVRVTEKAGFCGYTVQEFHNRPVRLYRMTGEEWLRHKSQ
ncbi:MAG: GNAT family N-acetyltransferase [Amphritea sp.]|nr:GNAT family N-acetyltransferase [Amphritea sp.]